MTVIVKRSSSSITVKCINVKIRNVYSFHTFHFIVDHPQKIYIIYIIMQGRHSIIKGAGKIRYETAEIMDATRHILNHFFSSSKTLIKNRPCFLLHLFFRSPIDLGINLMFSVFSFCRRWLFYNLCSGARELIA